MAARKGSFRTLTTSTPSTFNNLPQRARAAFDAFWGHPPNVGESIGYRRLAYVTIRSLMAPREGDEAIRVFDEALKIDPKNDQIIDKYNNYRVGAGLEPVELAAN
jgi:hypothetical protein